VHAAVEGADEHGAVRRDGRRRPDGAAAEGARPEARAGGKVERRHGAGERPNDDNVRSLVERGRGLLAAGAAGGPRDAAVRERERAHGRVAAARHDEAACNGHGGRGLDEMRTHGDAPRGRRRGTAAAGARPGVARRAEVLRRGPARGGPARAGRGTARARWGQGLSGDEGRQGGKKTAQPTPHRHDEKGVAWTALESRLGLR